MKLPAFHICRSGRKLSPNKSLLNFHFNETITDHVLSLAAAAAVATRSELIPILFVSSDHRKVSASVCQFHFMRST